MLSFNKQRGILLAPSVGFTMQTVPWVFEGTMQIGLPLMDNLSFNLLIILYDLYVLQIADHCVRFARIYRWKNKVLNIKSYGFMNHGVESETQT